MKRECSGSVVPDVTLKRGKENHKFTFTSDESNVCNTSGTLTNLLQSVEKQKAISK